MVLTVGIITELIRGDVFQWGKIIAGCVLAAAPGDRLRLNSWPWD
jgi:multiple sugar transport system permease protein